MRQVFLFNDVHPRALKTFFGQLRMNDAAKLERLQKNDAAKTQLQALKIPLGMFKLQTGDYPSNDAGLGALLTAPGDVSEEKWRGPYLPKQLAPDPWGNNYEYEKTSEGYRIWSNGPDANSNKDDISTSASRPTTRSKFPRTPSQGRHRSTDKLPVTITHCLLSFVLLLESPCHAASFLARRPGGGSRNYEHMSRGWWYNR